MESFLIYFIFKPLSDLAASCLNLRQLRSWFNILVKCSLALTLFISSSFPVLANANGLRCEEVFSTDHEIIQFSNKAFEQAYKDEYQNIQSWWKQKSVQLLRNRIKNKVEQTCVNGCTQKDISRLVTESIESAFAKMDKASYQMRRIRGYALLTGLSVGTILGTSYIKANLPVHEKFLADVVSIATTLAIYKLGAPLLDQVTALAVRGGYRLRDGKEFFRKNIEFERMRALYKVLREKMTPLEQEAATRLGTLLGQLGPTFGTAIESMQSMDRSKGGMQAAAARIADIAIRMRQFFPEVRADDPEVVRTIDMVFTQRVVMEDPLNADMLVPDVKSLEALYGLTIKQIEKYDPIYKESPDAAETYRHSIRVWFGLE